jgi:hypothetical protein
MRIDPMLVYDGDFEGVREKTQVCRPQHLASVLSELEA